MFGIPKLLPLCLLLSFTFNFYAPSLFAFSNTFFSFPLSEETQGQRSRCVQHAAAALVIGKFSDAALKWFFCLLRAWRSESSFSYSPQEITAADVEIISPPDISSSQHAERGGTPSLTFPAYSRDVAIYTKQKIWHTRAVCSDIYSCACNWECQCLCEAMMICLCAVKV